MSARSQSNADGGAAVTGPRRVVASYPTYAEAEKAVDHLSDNRFPVERVSIVGRGLNFVEQVTGRMSYGRAALMGAAQGALIGVLIGWLFAIFDWFDPIVRSGWLILDGLWFGAVVGALLGLLMHALTGGRRDFASVGTFKADRYEVLVDEEVAPEAERLLGGMTATTTSTPDRPGATQPPRPSPAGQ
jgi:hypothetical protein